MSAPSYCLCLCDWGRDGTNCVYLDLPSAVHALPIGNAIQNFGNMNAARIYMAPKPPPPLPKRRILIVFVCVSDGKLRHNQISWCANVAVSIVFVCSCSCSVVRTYRAQNNATQAISLRSPFPHTAVDLRKGLWGLYVPLWHIPPAYVLDMRSLSRRLEKREQNNNFVAHFVLDGIQKFTWLLTRMHLRFQRVRHTAYLHMSKLRKAPRFPVASFLSIRNIT